MITIDGSRGEGGGQILRTALALSTVTKKPFCIKAIRAKRQKPGLLRQHLTCVQAAQQICAATVDGAELGSQTVTFVPGSVVAGDYDWAIGTAGSTTLVLQTVLFGLLCAVGPSSVTLVGGTHNPLAPPFDFLKRSFLPLLERMGARVSLRMERPGFYPAGGGRIVVGIEPIKQWSPIFLLAPMEVTRKQAVAIVANLSRDIAERELATIGSLLQLEPINMSAVSLRNSASPGNVLTVDIESRESCEVFTGFAGRGIPAETVAANVAAEVCEYLAAGVPVGRYLADQLILPLALAGAGAFRTMALSDHSVTQIETVRLFLDVSIDVVEEGQTRIVRF